MNRSTNNLENYGTAICKGALLVFILLISSISMYAQQGSRIISGTVLDENGEPLPGAHVMQKKINKDDSQAAVVVDVNGKFMITVPASTKELEVSYMGYDTQVVALTTAKNYEIKLRPSSEVMDEVIVTGAFTRKANTYTGSVTTVKGDELLRVGNANLLSSLSNIDPSFVKIDNLSAGSNPNAMPDYQMRGQTGFADLKVNTSPTPINLYLSWMVLKPI